MFFSMYDTIVFAAESDNTPFDEFKISVFSNVVGATNISVYQDNQKCLYMGVDDICRLTRSTISQQSNNKFRKSGDERYLKHGVRNIKLKVSKNQLLEQKFRIQHEIKMHLHNGELLIEAEPMLIYLGADLSVYKGSENSKMLICKMPELTFWEAMDKDFAAPLDVKKYYGGDTNLTIQMSCDIIMDMIFGHGFFASTDDYYKDGYYEILNYSFENTDVILKNIADGNNKNNEILKSYNEVMKTGVDTFSGIVEAKSEPWKVMQEISYNNVKAANFNLNHASETMKDYYNTELEKALKTNSAVNTIYDDYFGKPLDNLEKASKMLKMMSFTFNFLNTYSSLYNVSAEKKELMQDVLSKEKTDAYGIDANSSCYKIANEILNDLNKTNGRKVSEVFINTALEDFKDDAIEEIINKLAEGSFTRLKFTFNLSKLLTYFIMHDEIEAFSDDLKGMFLSDIQHIVYNNLCAIYNAVVSEKCSEIDTLEDYRCALSYYCLSTVCMYEKLRNGQTGLALSDRDKSKAINTFNPEIEKITDIYYGLVICDVSPIIDIDSIDFNVINELIFGDSESKSNTTTAPTKQNPSIIKDNTYRDIVLVLDTSGSMSGDPIDTTVGSAQEFVNQVAGGNTRVGIVSYATNAYVVCNLTNNTTELMDHLEYYDASGQTNMYDGIEKADELLKQSSAEKKIIVLMSDGLPNRSSSENLYSFNSYGDEVVEYALQLKNKGYFIYTLGFFQKLYGSELIEAQELMDRIAGEGYYYDINETDSINFFFNDVATDISGQHSILVKIACPVDVYVTFNGETLTSDQSAPNNRTSFGSISYTGEYDEVKNVRLLEGANYDIVIRGTGEGTMTYSISYPDDSGAYTDVRTFEDIPITDKTVVETNTKKKRKTVVKLDSDGDGRTDVKYQAVKNGTGEVAPDYTNVIVVIAVLVAIGAAVKLIGVERIKKLFAVKTPITSPVPLSGQSVVAGYCGNCGGQLESGGSFCPHCGFDNSKVMMNTPQNSSSNAKFCGNCGHTLSSEAVYCDNCGHDTREDNK